MTRMSTRSGRLGRSEWMHCTKAGTIALGISGMRLTSVYVREASYTYLDDGDGGENEGGVGVA